MFEYECATAEEVLQHYAAGARNKQMASTAMNVASSRSHTVLVLTLCRTSCAEDDGLAKRQVVSKLSLVALAGSERAAASKASGSTASLATSGPQMLLGRRLQNTYV